MLDEFSQIIHDMSPAEREAYFARPAEDRRAERLAWLGARSLARAGVRPLPDHSPATLARSSSAPVVSLAEPERVPAPRSLSTDLRDSEAHRASQSRPAERATLTLRRPPAPTGTRVERHAQVARPTDTVPVGRNLTTELQKGGQQ